MSHQFGYAFIFCPIVFFAESFPILRNRVDYSLYSVEVSGGSCRLAFYIVLLKIVVQPQCMLSIDQWLRTMVRASGYLPACC